MNVRYTLICLVCKNMCTWFVMIRCDKCVFLCSVVAISTVAMHINLCVNMCQLCAHAVRALLCLRCVRVVSV